jgi:site-specific recombinase XerC
MTITGQFTEMQRLVHAYVRGRVSRREIAPSTGARVRSILLGFAESYGRRPVRLLGRRHVELWLEQRQDLSPASLRNEFQAVRQFTRWLLAERHIRTDPVAQMRAPRVPRSVPRAIPEADVRRLLDVLPDARARLVVGLMLLAGLRRGEVIGVQLGDYDPGDTAGGSLTVTGKGGHTRIIPVTDELARMIDGYLLERGRSAGPLILRNDGTGGISNSRVGQLVRMYMEASGVKQRAGDGRAAHSLRHTLATRIAKVEPDLRVVQNVLGHRSLTSTQIYLRHAELGRVRDAMSRAAGDVA